ncbi:calcium/manganese antiporter SLC30A10-like [Acipenser ruthenus]|uniref:calcium/manganese antiporter SLC30A10-like n=1 Tax=Acipenser ruthenus TaxID=7906 RepID=UPI0027427F3F|nr:calcium/manganese antiporter SLC30A10-like [Acipenser ruthenus]
MGRYTGNSCRLIVLSTLTLALFLVELVIGYMGNAVTLTSDAFSVFSHLLSMIIGFSGVHLSHVRRHRRFTFGLTRAEVLGAFCNAVLATAFMFTVLAASCSRLVRARSMNNVGLVLIMGVVGLAFNIISYTVFMGCCWPCKHPGSQETSTAVPQGTGLSSHETAAQWLVNAVSVSFLKPLDTLTEVWPPVSPGSSFSEKDDKISDFNCSNRSGPVPGEKAQQPADAVDRLTVPAVLSNSAPDNPGKRKQSQTAALNIRGVLLHVMGDALGSVVVVVAASLFYAMPLPPDAPCNWQCYVDPSLTIIMVIIILSSAFPLVKETTAILLQMVPRGLRVDHIREVLAQVPGVLSIHELHIWELAAGRNIATLHLKCGDSGVFQGVSQQVREIFHNAGVHAVTIQPEYTKKDQDLLACNAPCLSEDCRTLGCCNATQPSTNAERHDELGIAILPEHCPSQYSRDNVVLKVTQL